jgi:hypothetical protein
MKIWLCKVNRQILKETFPKLMLLVIIAKFDESEISPNVIEGTPKQSSCFIETRFECAFFASIRPTVAWTVARKGPF